MAKVDTKLIQGLFEIFSPHILEEQSIIAYVGEDITPYIIRGENFSTIQAQLDNILSSISSLQNSLSD